MISVECLFDVFLHGRIHVGRRSVELEQTVVFEKQLVVDGECVYDIDVVLLPELRYFLEQVVFARRKDDVGITDVISVERRMDVVFVYVADGEPDSSAFVGQIVDCKQESAIKSRDKEGLVWQGRQRRPPWAGALQSGFRRNWVFR